MLLCWPLSMRSRHHDRFVLIGLCWLYGRNEFPPPSRRSMYWHVGPSSKAARDSCINCCHLHACESSEADGPCWLQWQRSPTPPPPPRPPFPFLGALLQSFCLLLCESVGSQAGHCTLRHDESDGCRCSDVLILANGKRSTSY